MSNRRAVIKIDLCGSKKFVDETSGEKNSIRKNTLKLLVEKVKEVFPYASSAYPEGSLYSAQGDCVYIILEKPTVALRATIEFMKHWYGVLDTSPDCRAVIDYGDLDDTFEIGRLELVGEPFENISVMEKLYQHGEIGCTSELKKNVDETLVQFMNPRSVNITLKRNKTSWRVNYENPRLVNDSSLVHALFISSLAGDDIRNKSFEVILIECIVENAWKSLSIEDLSSWFKKRNIPDPGYPKIRDICNSSNHLSLDEQDRISVNESKIEVINSAKKVFEESRKKALNYIAVKLGHDLGVDGAMLTNKINLDNLVEEYLSAIFLEIRIMANYFRSTQTVFEKLSTANEFDSIIKKHIGVIVSSDLEMFTIAKNSFVNSLMALSKKNNVYLAAIFHNVLMLYYLNRNSKFAHAQLKQIRKKSIYLDTNTFYALRCRSSSFHEMLSFSISKMREMNANINIFDKSISEYNDSINSALYKYRKGKGVALFSAARKPWIWIEYEANSAQYNNNFEYCVAFHRFPSKEDSDQYFDNVELSKQLKDEYGINLKLLEPYLDKEDLGELYEETYRAKMKFDHVSNWLEPIGGSHEFHHMLVIHDANCLEATKCPGTSPYNFKNLFVTCDYSLARIRKRKPKKYDHLMTISEFYEFMLPYLFLADVMTSKPVEMPNFLLASALTATLDQSISFESLIGLFLSHGTENSKKHDYKILSEMEATRRFDKIKKDHEKLLSTSSDMISEESLKEYAYDFASVAAEYKSKVKEKTSNALIFNLYQESQEKLSKISEEKEQLESRLNLLENKEKKRKRFLKKQKRIAAKNKPNTKKKKKRY